MANTRLSNPIIVASNTDPAPNNVVTTPSNGSDGKYTWACVGQKNTGATSVLTFSMLGTASSPVVSGTVTNMVTATCQAKANSTNYVQVTASYAGNSNNLNWTVYIGTGTASTVRFTRGTGGGGTKKPAKKAALKGAAKPAAKKVVKKAAKKAPAKAVKKIAKKVVKTSSSRASGKAAAKPVRKPAKPARKARRK